MMISKLAFAAGLFVASSLGGVALGSYTIGGFRIDDPPDTIGGLAEADASSEAPAPPVPAPVMDYVHVCKGCDAKLHRDEDWRYEEPVYQEAHYEDYGEAEDLMPQEDALSHAVASVRDEPSVVQMADAVSSGGDGEASAPVTLAHSF